MCGFEPGCWHRCQMRMTTCATCWCRCRVPLPTVHGRVHFGASLLLPDVCASCALEFGCWSRCRVLLPDVYGSARFGVWVQLLCCGKNVVLSGVRSGVIFSFTAGKLGIYSTLAAAGSQATDDPNEGDIWMDWYVTEAARHTNTLPLDSWQAVWPCRAPWNPIQGNIRQCTIRWQCA